MPKLIFLGIKDGDTDRMVTRYKKTETFFDVDDTLGDIKRRLKTSLTSMKEDRVSHFLDRLIENKSFNRTGTFCLSWSD
jgi:hypothetical protein